MRCLDLVSQAPGVFELQVRFLNRDNIELLQKAMQLRSPGPSHNFVGTHESTSIPCSHAQRRATTKAKVEGAKPTTGAKMTSAQHEVLRTFP